MRYRIFGVVLTAALTLGGTTPEPRRIVGGEAATVYDYPFVVNVIGMLGGQVSRVCTGTLVDPVWALTAAHCVDGFTPDSVFVGHGFPDVFEFRFATEFQMHPDYDPLSEHGKHFDIALVRMESAFLSRTAATVRMATAQELLTYTAAGTMTTTVGWGGPESETMREAEWSIVACPASVTTAERICTSPTQETRVENGDSGGPLLVRETSTGDWMQTGVLYWSDPTGFHYYASIGAYAEWIASTTSEPARLSVTFANKTGQQCSITGLPGGLGLGMAFLEVGETESHVFDELPVNATLTIQCSEDVLAPVIPPSPPPAPPAFEPEAVEVMLGDHGGTVTLMTTEAGGFTLDGGPFESGGTVTAENGSRYRLVLSDGRWTATLVEDSP